MKPKTVYESRIAGLPCMKHGCHELRAKSPDGRYYRFCAAHELENRARRDEYEFERYRAECDLAHLLWRWEHYPDLRPGFVDGQRVVSMERGDDTYRVLLAGAAAFVELSAETLVELRWVASDAVLRGVPV